MRRMTTSLVIVFVVLALSSCTHTVTVPEIVYRNITVDLQDSITVLQQTRPDTLPAFRDDLKAKIEAGEILTDEDLVFLALAYKIYGDSWMDYAIRLEQMLMATNNIIGDLET